MNKLTTEQAKKIDFNNNNFPTKAWINNIDEIYSITCGELYFPVIFLGKKEQIEILAEKLADNYSNKSIPGFIAYYEENNIAMVSLRYFDENMIDDEEIDYIYKQIDKSVSTLELFDLLPLENDGFEFKNQSLPSDYLKIAKFMLQEGYL